MYVKDAFGSETRCYDGQALYFGQVDRLRVSIETNYTYGEVV